MNRGINSGGNRMDKNIGKKLDGRYEITELIGVGGMAEVYKGVDVIDNKAVAIKILKKEYAENEEFLRRFRNESKAIAVLSHPNIVKIYDVGFSEKIQYIVMEYIDGITLKEYIEEERVLTWKDTVHFVIQILRALQHAHDKGIVHRDIKPQNIMMFTDGTIKVMDFGIAKFAREDGKTATDQAIGSVHYISPEQASGNVTDAKSDIYSVGAMMYEMLTGRKPFDSDNPVAIAVMHMHDIPERPRAINSDIPDGLEEIVLRAMEKAPEDRYATTADMISDIEAFKATPSITFGYYREEGDDSEDTRFFNAPSASGGEVRTETTEEPEKIYAPKAPAYAPAGAAAAAMYQGGNNPQQRYPQPPPPYNGGYYPEEEEEEEERSSLIVPVLTAIIVVVIIVGVIFAAVLLKDLLTGSDKKGDFEMKDFVGMDYNEAYSQYSNNIRFEVVDSVHSEEYDENEIIWQSIEPGEPFDKGVTLEVKISKGNEEVEVPKLVGVNAELAKDQLRQRNLEFTINQKPSDEYEKGYVMESDPPEGTVVKKGSYVVLTVSMGSEGDIEVDNYVGMDIEDATKMAGYRKLKVIAEPKHSYEDEGTVVEQSIEPKSMVEKDTEIILYYSDGITPDGEVAYRMIFPDEASGRFVVDFVLAGEDGQKNIGTSKNIVLPEMNDVTEKIKGSGEDVEVTVIITNTSNGQRQVLGRYKFNFAEDAARPVTPLEENIEAAMKAIGAIPEPTTEEPTEEPTTTTTTTEPPTEPITEPPTEPTEVPTDEWGNPIGGGDNNGGWGDNQWGGQ